MLPVSNQVRKTNLQSYHPYTQGPLAGIIKTTSATLNNSRKWRSAARSGRLGVVNLQILQQSENLRTRHCFPYCYPEKHPNFKGLLPLSPFTGMFS